MRYLSVMRLLLWACEVSYHTSSNGIAILDVASGQIAVLYSVYPILQNCINSFVLQTIYSLFRRIQKMLASCFVPACLGENCSTSRIEGQMANSFPVLLHLSKLILFLSLLSPHQFLLYFLQSLALLLRFIL